MKVGMISLGCAKNQVDSEEMLFMLRNMGHEIVSDEQQAEAIIVNTCGFIDSAKEESIDAILSAARLKETGACRKLFVTGCLAQRYAAQLMDEIPEIDGLIGVEHYADFPRYFEQMLAGTRVEDVSRVPGGFSCGRVLTTPPFSAYVRIAEGCDNRCAYCAIPLIRGGYRSRPAQDVLTEMRALARDGAREQVLIAQDTSRYGRDRGETNGLTDLIARAGEIPGIDWLRVLYLYPEDVTKEMVDRMAQTPSFCRYLDVPLQHSVPRLLRSMNRRGDIRRIEDTLAYAREKGFALRTTFIVGFPGETDEDFDALCDFTRRVAFDRMGAFVYSPEEDTPAYSMPGQVARETAQQRLDTLMTLQAGISLGRNQARVGTGERVLVCEKRGDGLFACRSAWEAPDADGWILVRGEANPGEMRDVVLTHADEYDLTARFADGGEKKA